MSAKQLSGVELSQNQTPENIDDHVPATSNWVYQTFYLPENYRRGTTEEEIRWPAISGFQVFVGIEEGWADVATLDWQLERYVFGEGWDALVSGTTVGAHVDGDEVWFDIYIDRPVEVISDTADDQYRLGLRLPPSDPDATSVLWGDEFLIDRSAEYQFASWGAPSFNLVDGKVVVNDPSQMFFASPGEATGDITMFAKAYIPDTTDGSINGTILSLVSGVDSAEWNENDGEGDVFFNGTTNTLYVRATAELAGSTFSDTNGVEVPNPNDLWLVYRRQGLQFTAEIWDTDPLQGDAPISSATITGVGSTGSIYGLYGDVGITIDSWSVYTAEGPTRPDQLPSSLAHHESVPYDGHRAIVEGQAIIADLRDGTPFLFRVNGIPSLLTYDSQEDQAYYSTQYGVNWYWYSAPNPLALRGHSRALGADQTSLQDDSRDVSLMFRVLTLSADDGVDYLGNPYRSVVTSAQANNASTFDSALKNRFWLSEPAPSKFAVKNLYFDNRDIDGNATTFDHILLDPITPGVFFHVYYSDEGDADENTTEQEWENKLWTHLPQTFQANRRDNYTPRRPITAKFVKIEFSHLQAQSYAPGIFQKAIRYKKHPKWVLDYFLARVVTDNQFVPRQVTVVNDALRLAYDYYTDDLGQSQAVPPNLDQDQQNNVSAFLTARTDISDQVDASTLEQITLNFEPWKDDPRLRASFNYILGEYSLNVAMSERATHDPGGEQTTSSFSPLGPTIPVSTLDREAVVTEAQWPVMFFFVTCRHRYREIVANFPRDRAYFVGIREIAFLRDRYTTAHDHDSYIETAGDNVNIERSDFVRTSDGIWTVSGSGTGGMS